MYLLTYKDIYFIYLFCAYIYIIFYFIYLAHIYIYFQCMFQVRSGRCSPAAARDGGAGGGRRAHAAHHHGNVETVLEQRNISFLKYHFNSAPPKSGVGFIICREAF